MGKSTLLSAALALSSLFAPLKAKTAQDLSTKSNTNLTENVSNNEDYAQYQVKELDIDGMPYFIYEPTNTARKTEQKRTVQTDLEELLKESDQCFNEKKNIQPPPAEKKSDILENLEKILSKDEYKAIQSPQDEVKNLFSELEKEENREQEVKTDSSSKEVYALNSAQKKPTKSPQTKNDKLNEVLDLLSKRTGSKRDSISSESFEDKLHKNIGFGALMASLVCAMIAALKKSHKKNKKAFSNQSVKKDIPPKKIQKEIPPKPIKSSYVSLPPYGIQLIPKELILSKASQKEEKDIKLLPYHPIELEIAAAKDPLTENNRELLAQRLMALKSIDEIQKERKILTRMIAKARRQKDERAIATITARRKILSEKIKKARYIVIGNQLDNIREQRRLLTKKITLARRHHDHWQVDSVQKQRATLKTKEKTVKGYVRQFNYTNYRHQWHIQRQKSFSRAA